MHLQQYFWEVFFRLLPLPGYPHKNLSLIRRPGCSAPPPTGLPPKIGPWPQPSRRWLRGQRPGSQPLGPHLPRPRPLQCPGTPRESAGSHPTTLFRCRGRFRGHKNRLGRDAKELKMDRRAKEIPPERNEQGDPLGCVYTNHAHTRIIHAQPLWAFLSSQENTSQ